MRQLKYFMFTVLVALVSFSSAFAYDFEVDGIFYNILSKEDLTCEVTYEKYEDFVYSSSYIGDIFIPETFDYNGNTYTVSKIGNFAFYNCSGLTSVTIPNSVTEIGRSAFKFCTGFTSVTIPNSVTKIGSSAFYNCSGLTSVTIPNSVSEIGEYAFYYCIGLTSVTIPNSVSEIGEYAFYWCSGLTSVTFPNSVTKIGDYAFYWCSGLTSLTIPNSVTEIGGSAFSGCSGLTSVTIPKSVTKIGNSAFFGCKNLSTVYIEDINVWLNALMSNSEDVFNNNYSIYLRGLKLTDLVIPQEITSIPAYCFYKCTGLESITFHENVKTIIQNAFNGCTNVKYINCQCINPPSCGAQALEGISRTECTLYVPEGCVANYKGKAPWSEFENIVGGSKETPDEPKTCKAPTISIVNGMLQIVSETNGSICKYSITSDDFKKGEVNENMQISLSGEYIITAYASTEGMYNSETVTAKLVWVNPTLVEDSGIFCMEAKKAVVIAPTANGLRISGTERGEMISVYSLEGNLIKSVVAEDETTEIACLDGLVVVKIGDKSIKINVK